MAEEIVGLSPADFERVRRAVLKAEGLPPRRPAQPGGAGWAELPSRWIKPTSGSTSTVNLAGGGTIAAYAAVWESYDSSAGTWSDQQAVWLITTHGTPAAGVPCLSRCVGADAGGQTIWATGEAPAPDSDTALQLWDKNRSIVDAACTVLIADADGVIQFLGGNGADQVRVVDASATQRGTVGLGDQVLGTGIKTVEQLGLEGIAGQASGADTILFGAYGMGHGPAPAGGGVPRQAGAVAYVRGLAGPGFPARLGANQLDIGTDFSVYAGLSAANARLSGGGYWSIWVSNGFPNQLGIGRTRDAQGWMGDLLILATDSGAAASNWQAPGNSDSWVASTGHLYAGWGYSTWSATAGKKVDGLTGTGASGDVFLNGLFVAAGPPPGGPGVGGTPGGTGLGWTGYTLTPGSFGAGIGTSKTINLGWFPAGTVIHAATLKLGQTWTGGGATTVQFSLGTDEPGSGTATVMGSVPGSASNWAASTINGGSAVCKVLNTSCHVTCTITMSAGSVGGLTAGKTWIELLTSQMVTLT